LPPLKSKFIQHRRKVGLKANDDNRCRLLGMLEANIPSVGKSAATRARLQKEALRLFADRGYDETTVADIAAAAGVTQMTFFRHFPAKELVIVDDPYDPAMAQAVAAQSPDLPVVERVRRGLLAAWEQLEDADEAEFRLRLQIGAGHHGLRARMRENNVRTEAAIAAALAERGVPAFQAVVATAAVIGALTAALLEWANDPDAGPMGDAVTAALALLEIQPPQ
jgi:AcrR family transcriptional regulator